MNTTTPTQHRTASLANSTRNDRFSEFLTVAVTLAAIGLGLLVLRSSQLETWFYENRESGIEGRYPAQWLVDEGGDYIVQIRDPRARPYKTEYVLRAVPLGEDSTIRNVLDNLSLQRSTTLPGYRVLDISERDLGGQQITEMRFVSVSTDPNPYVEHFPIIVLGLDRVFRDGSRAIVVTFRSARESFDANLPAFEQFIASLQF